MDSSIGRLQAALANVTNEVTVAAANLNFDFSLVKFEAPKEFQPVGQLLSARRKHEAETGTSHATARRLAALFAGICPPSPELIKAYGVRASEIAEEAVSKTSKEHYASIFSSYAGIDATSIWAAATSAKDVDGGAIQIHLLACLFATAFDAPSAISIWSQIIEARRAEISTRVNDGEQVPFALAAAAVQAEIPRPQLAEWDMSARSWLETANEIKKKEQTKFGLILTNIEVTAGSSKRLYENDIEVWKTAVGTMNNLVAGIPQEIQDGATVIGLSAWHLYPNMDVFGTKHVHVEMNDPLIPKTGVLSLGCSGSANPSKSGVSWSLSLAHLKFYGEPVQTTGIVQADASRLTIKEFRLVLLGSIMRLWGIAPSQEATAICVLAALSISTRREIFATANTRWFAFRLIEKAEAHLRANEEGSRIFINLGRNRPQFRPESVQGANEQQRPIQPFFGLLKEHNFLTCLKRPEDRIRALLWRCARHRKYLCQRGAVIQYKVSGDMNIIALVDDANQVPNPNFVGYPVVYMQWLESDVLRPVVWPEGESTTDPSDHKGKSIIEAFGIPANRVNAPDLNTGKEGGKSEAAKAKSDNDENDDEDENENGENEDYEDDVDDEEMLEFSQVLNFNNCAYVVFFGDPMSAAIYLPAGNEELVSPHFELEDIARALDRDIIALNTPLTEDDSLLHWLADFEFSLQTLRSLPGPVISVRILRSVLPRYPEWIKVRHDRFSVGWPYHSTPETFSVLAFFLAQCEVSPSDLENSVSGLSYGDSIYVPTELLHDPLVSKRNGRDGLTRILGNVGRAGLVIFSSVDRPVVAPESDTQWRFIDVHAFDGLPDNYFKSTSMHLSFTQWETSIGTVASHGNRDTQFSRRESVVSIRDAGRWIGDVDVVAALKSKYIYVLPSQEPCNHEGTGQCLDSSIRSIESWDELREVQTGIAVVRVHGNWLTRLAVTAFLAQRADMQGHSWARITLLPEKVCWTCLKQEFPTNFYIY